VCQPARMPWLDHATLELHAAVVGRPFPLGFWDSKQGDRDSEQRAGPRPLYRAVPAGAVYYLTLRPAPGKSLDSAIDVLFERLWFRSLHRNRRNEITYFGRAGFGVMAIGGWDE